MSEGQILAQGCRHRKTEGPLNVKLMAETNQISERRILCYMFSTQCSQV